GVEPRSPACDAGVVPLDQQPISPRPNQRSARDSNPNHLSESSRQDSNLRYPVCKTGVFAARRRDDLRTVARVGFEPTGTRLSTRSRCQLAYRAIDSGTPNSCGSGSRTSAAKRMKLGRAPAHPQSQAPVSSRADRPHEGQPGTCLAWEKCNTD